MEDLLNSDPLRAFQDLPDPRAANARHPLRSILAIALCAMLGDANGWADFEKFAKGKRSWLETFLELPHGIPGADTFARLFARLDPLAMERCFMAWMQTVVDLSGGKLLAIDGKSLRGSFEHVWDKSGMAHMVSAFAEHNGQVFAQIKCEGKGQELQAIKQLLGMVDLAGTVVSVDALGTQKEIAETIVDKGGDYVMAVKDNHPTLHRAIQVEMDDMIRDGFAGVSHSHEQSVDAGHGRIETRKVWATDQIQWLKQAEQWPGLRSVVVVEAERDVPAVGRSVQRRYFITSLAPDAERLAQAIRGHWSVENALHHVLDVTFHEDASRIRKGHAAENISRLRRMVLNLLKERGPRITKCKSIRGLRKLASWSEEFLAQLLAG